VVRRAVLVDRRAVFAEWVLIKVNIAANFVGVRSFYRVNFSVFNSLDRHFWPFFRPPRPRHGLAQIWPRDAGNAGTVTPAEALRTGF
jgi:hypothetical protein